MRVLFTSTRGEGHVRPLLPYADALRRLGHEVLFAAPQDCATIIGKAGFSQAAFDRITDDEFRAIWAPHKGVREEAMLKIAVPEMFAGATARASLPGLSAAADEWRPDLVVPQAEVFPHAAAMLNHGGSGTLLGGFAAAVPQVVAPLFADQPFNARRTAERGLGLSVADPTPDALSAALSEIFVRQDITQKTRALAQAMAVQPVPDDAALRLVELA
jgi:UDP:flavonoid glycosyltransferase YjiC (YdhE family)